MKKAVTEPELIAPFIKQQTHRIPRKILAESVTFYQRWRLPRQKPLIDDLRQENDYLLIILDACRFDYFQEEYSDFLDGELQPVFNTARDTFEYVQNVWPGYYDEVTYVSGATPVNSVSEEFSDHHLESLYDGYQPSEHIDNIIDVWSTDWDTDLGVTPPEKVTEKSLQAAADGSKVVAHYFQPHAPYIGEKELTTFKTGKDAEPLKGEPVNHEIWERMKQGEISRAEKDRLYRSNLRRALETVKTLVQYTDFEKVVVTADHGEALGEFGVYAHPRWLHHPSVRVVPWLEVKSSEDSDKKTTNGDEG